MADTAPQVKLLTEDELLRLDAQDEKFEVINGELVPMPPVGIQHAEISVNLLMILKPYAKEHDLGRVYSDNLMYILRMHEDGVRDSRSPDTSFIRKGRFPKDFDLTRPFPGAPDLAVEIISPSESAISVIEKVGDYLSEGTEEVWVIYPKHRTLHRFRRNDPDTVRIYHEDDTLEPDSLFPGLKIPVAACFENA